MCHSSIIFLLHENDCIFVTYVNLSINVYTHYVGLELVIAGGHFVCRYVKYTWFKF